MFTIICLFCLVISYFVTGKVLNLAQKYNIVDDPKLEPTRKKQPQPVPLLGGLGFGIVAGLGTIFVWLMMRFNWFNQSARLYQNLFYDFHLGWILVAGVILTIGGFLDDKLNFSSRRMFLIINIAVIIAVGLGGVRVESLSYPFDRILPDQLWLHSLLAYIWIMLCVSATKFLDGHDGLVATIGVWTLLTIAVVSLFANVNQPLIFILACIWASSILGFLPYNLPNAKIYLGEIGSETIGFVIGVLSILSGAKVATASSIIGWFVLDLLLVFIIRFQAHKNLLAGGREHWHFRLVDSGFSKWQVLIFTLVIVVVSSILGLTLPTQFKPFVWILQLLILLIIFFGTQKPTQNHK